MAEYVTYVVDLRVALVATKQFILVLNTCGAMLMEVGDNISTGGKGITSWLDLPIKEKKALEDFLALPFVLAVMW